MKIRYLVTNSNNCEGAMFNNEDDAKKAAGLKKLGREYSALAGKWRDLYGDEGKHKIQEIQVDD